MPEDAEENASGEDGPEAVKAQQHFFAIMEDLYYHRISPDELDEESLKVKSGLGENLVHYLTVESKVEIAERLILRGLPCDEYSNLGTTPLLDCAYIGLWDSVELLLRHGADPNKVKIDSGDSAMHKAAWGGYRDLYDLLRAHGGDLHALNHMEETPFGLLAKKSSKGEIIPSRKCAKK